MPYSKKKGVLICTPIANGITHTLFVTGFVRRLEKVEESVKKASHTDCGGTGILRRLGYIPRQQN